MSCAGCGKTPLTLVETGLTRKLINRGATSCYCLALRFRVTREQLLEMAEAFRASGCTLFR